MDSVRGVLVKEDFVRSTRTVFEWVFRRFDRNIASVLTRSKVTPFSLAQSSVASAALLSAPATSDFPSAHHAMSSTNESPGLSSDPKS